jgi:hypothetical protein
MPLYSKNNCMSQRWIGSFFVTEKYFNGTTKMKKKFAYKKCIIFTRPNLI